jgi:uncharacterized RDD family membrane protein YckC
MLEEEKQIEAASAFERIIAASLDAALFFSVWFWTFYYILKTTVYVEPLKRNIYFLFFAALFLLYCAFLNANGRQTLGKFLLGIKVVSKTGEGRVCLARGLLRACAYVVNFFTMFLGFIPAFVAREGRALEDYIAGTKVIRVRKKSCAETTVISMIGLILTAGIAFYAYYAAYIMPDYSDRIKIDAARKQLENIGFLEAKHRIIYGKYTDDFSRLALLSGDSVQFQRDVQNALRRKGFAIGISKTGYSIKGVAKDGKSTPVEINYADARD